MTRNEKYAIRRYYAHYHAIKVLADDTVIAQQSPGCPFGVLYTPEQARSHLNAIKQTRAK